MKVATSMEVRGIIFVLSATIMIRFAWVCDDAFITARVIENLVNGYGPVCNVGERVQTYTHVLWFWLNSFSYLIGVQLFRLDFPRQMYLMLILNSLIISSLAIGLLVFRFLKSEHGLICGVLALILSRSFMDFTTSGLEMPLTYLLLLLFFTYSVRRPSPNVRTLSLLFSAIVLNRMDILLLIAPLWCYRIVGARKDMPRMMKDTLVGLLPLIVWEMFSVFYYGFPFPNTYYAKVTTGWPLAKRIMHGLAYHLQELDSDPITLFFILSTVVLTLVTLKKTHLFPTLPALAGLFFYDMYIFSIGGDFMQGRFFAPLLLWSIMICDSIPLPRYFSLYYLIPLLLLGYSGHYPVFKPQEEIVLPHPFREEIVHPNAQGIVDERLFYLHWSKTNLLFFGTAKRPKQLFDSPYRGRHWRREKSKPQALSFINTAGLAGYQAGPQVHIIDACSLLDPLLARLPANVDSRIGHYRPTIPKGYLYAVQKHNPSLISNAQIRDFYKALQLIVSGPLFSYSRLKAIVKVNVGLLPLPQQYESATKAEIEQFRHF